MAEVILMPLLSDTMTEGVVAVWHKKIGDQVKENQLLAEIESDKATLEFESPAEGVLLYHAEAGKPIAVNAVLAIVGSANEDISSYLSGNAQETTTSGTTEQTNLAANDTQQTPAVVDDHTVVASHTTDEHKRLKASPIAKNIAAESQLDLNTIKGSGDEGRIIKRDVLAALQNQATTIVETPAPPATTQQPATVVTTTQREESAAQEVSNYQRLASDYIGNEQYQDVRLSQMRKTIARRLTESKNNAPHFYLKMTVRMDQAMAFREQLNAHSSVRISFNDIVIKACAMALRQHQVVNSSWLDDRIRQNHHISIGMAVALDEGLVVPVIRFADNKSLAQISTEAKALGAKARDKKLTTTEMQGNTFTISNLGMYDVEEFTAIINPPDACILAVGGIQQLVAIENGAPAVQHHLKLTLSCDHRVVDGATGAKFLQTLKALLENPITLLV